MNDSFDSGGLFQKMMQTVREVIATGLPSRVVVSAEGQDQDLAYLYVVREDAGFTWDDVDLLERVAGHLSYAGWEGGNDLLERSIAVNKLADRLAAILPPRTND